MSLSLDEGADVYALATVGAARSGLQPLIHAFYMETMQTCHHSQLVSNFKILEANRALLTFVEAIMHVPPGHNRQVTDLTTAETLIGSSAPEKRTT